MPANDVKQTGYVSQYTLKLTKPPWVDENRSKVEHLFFEVIITAGEGSESGAEPVTFKLPRDIGTFVDGEVPLALSFGSVEMAMIATLKDALLYGKRVIVEGTAVPVDTNPRVRYNQLTSVTIIR